MITLKFSFVLEVDPPFFLLSIGLGHNHSPVCCNHNLIFIFKVAVTQFDSRIKKCISRSSWAHELILICKRYLNILRMSFDDSE